MCFARNEVSLVAVTFVTEHPIHVCTIDADGVRHALLPGVNGTVRRQDMPPVYRANVAIYVNDAGEIDLDTSFNDNEDGFVMSAGRSVDIDDLEDFDHAERALQAGYGERGEAPIASGGVEHGARCASSSQTHPQFENRLVLVRDHVGGDVALDVLHEHLVRRVVTAKARGDDGQEALRDEFVPVKLR